MADCPDCSTDGDSNVTTYGQRNFLDRNGPSLALGVLGINMNRVKLKPVVARVQAFSSAVAARMSPRGAHDDSR